MSDWNKAVIEEFRANEGKVEQFSGATLLLLHTTGAKSGLERINPLLYKADGQRYLIVASKAGAPSHPDWYYNILANPKVNLEVGTEKFDALATVAEEPERTQLYEQMEAMNPIFTEYQSKVTRIIPIIFLTRS
jgi:deazaflavin-dependent oxidoreductase (nitroreductase family)